MPCIYLPLSYLGYIKNSRQK